MSFRIKIIISIPPIRASPVVKEHNKLTYLSAARCQLILVQRCAPLSLQAAGREAVHGKDELSARADAAGDRQG